ncbi:uncharacterized protein PAC_17550 [Phialocephala subalpina]|uniref:Uncharacterized protein n=1 Tax=Phialocephala subalpina TaxID=576137 RepID=A0A1L7XRG4_9HELO|nr:uncharacterized protein PAC_17550 [Phialocephala subalpina]
MAEPLDLRDQRIKDLEGLLSNSKAEKERLEWRLRNPPAPGLWQPGKSQEYCREELNTINTSLAEWANDFAATTAAPWQNLPARGGSFPSFVQNIFARPFFCAPNHRISPLGGELSWMYIEPLKGDKVAAHKWRYETLRCLSPLDDQKLHTQTRTLLNQAAKDEVDLFLGSAISCLLNTNRKNEYHRRLVEIFETASWRAYDIWCERAYIRCTPLKEFSEMTFGGGGERWPADYLEKLKQMLDMVKSDGELLCTRPWVELVDTVVEENAEGVKQEHEDCIHLSAPFYVEL